MSPKLVQAWGQCTDMEGNESILTTDSQMSSHIGEELVENVAPEPSTDSILSPKKSLSPSSKRAFFFAGFKQKEMDRSVIISDARQAAIEAAQLASRGIIAAHPTAAKRGSEKSPRKNKAGMLMSDSVSPSLESMAASHTMTAKTLITSTTLESGKIETDDSACFDVENADRLDKKKKHKNKRKPFAKFANSADILKPAVYKADGTVVSYKTARKVTQGLWMCNLCGMAFTSLHGAEDHENMCVRMACAYSHFFEPSTVPTAALSPSLAEVDTSPAWGSSQTQGVVFLNRNVRRMMVMTDQSVVKVVGAAKPYLSTSAETDCERELSLLARDCAYYHHIERRAELRREASGRWRALTKAPLSGTAGIISTVKTRLADAYDLIKEGEAKSERRDHYNQRSSTERRDITHTSKTMYVNVLVKNSAQVVSNELQRLAKLRWQAEQDTADPNNPFAKFRSHAQNYVVRLASLALGSDFNPRRIAVQTSNDFYRLLVPELKRRGVRIETDIEYRVGAFFVLAINVLSIDWVRLIEYTHEDISRRKVQEKLRRLAAAQDATQRDNQKQQWRLYLRFWKHFPTVFDAMGIFISFLYYVHWAISIPFCYFWYYLFLRQTFHMYICQSVIDDLYRYVESKGMEMDLNVKRSFDQASFMLAMLRQMRADERKQKKEKEAGEEKPLLGDLLGAHIKEDKNPASAPPDFKPPESLDYLCLEIDVPVGFRRLRWALLRSDSEFERNAIQTVEERYQNIVIGQWSKYDDQIGMPNPPADVDINNFLGATRDQEALMPANAMVKANTAYSTLEITEYSNHCFAYKKRTRTPEVPFGSSFCTWTQVVVYDLGKENSHIICSSGAEFPNSRPMVARQIESGIRTGTTESFVRMGETICRYA